MDPVSGWVTVREGPFEGWRIWTGEPFETLAGPYYFRAEADGSMRGAFLPETQHLNSSGAVHGGALMTFADALLGALVYDDLHGQFAVTVTFNSEFLAGGVEGARIDGHGRVLRHTRSMAFAQGVLEQDGGAILGFSGTLKKLAPR